MEDNLQRLFDKYRRVYATELDCERLATTPVSRNMLKRMREFRRGLASAINILGYELIHSPESKEVDFYES